MTRAFERWSGRTLSGVAAFVVATSLAGAALGQSETSGAGLGPISGSTRFVGLGGAFVGIAEDTEGVAINPASDAVRLPYSWSAWDYGIGLDVAIGAWLPKNDVYNQGSNNSGKSSALFGSLAGVLNYNHLGFGLAAQAQRNAATRVDQEQGVTTSLDANYGIVHASTAYGFLDGQLLVGAGSRLVGTSLGSSSNSGIFSAAGVGYEAGFIVKPLASQYRIAAAGKSPIDATVPGGSSTSHVPWELSFGFAHQFGARQLNPKFVTARDLARAKGSGTDPSDAELKAAEDELFRRYQKQPRFYVLVSSQITVLQGGSQWGAGQDGASRDIISPRLGLESEVIPNILKLRAGTYYEPALIDRVPGRMHGTGGFDVRLFRWNVFGLIKRFDYWKLSLGADAARSYLNTSFTIGFWH